MQNHSRKPHRARVAPGIYFQNGAYRAHYREPGTGRSRSQKLEATTVSAA